MSDLIRSIQDTFAEWKYMCSSNNKKSRGLYVGMSIVAVLAITLCPVMLIISLIKHMALTAIISVIIMIAAIAGVTLLVKS